LKNKDIFRIASLKTKNAYSLVELSVVITIMSILMMGVASIVSASMKKAQKNETQEKMQIIYNAMGKFLLRNQRLPCPARLNLAESSAGYGSDKYITTDVNDPNFDKSITNGDCNNSSRIFSSNTGGNINIFVGAVPTTTLGLSSDMAKDEFGNKITYIISKNATIATTATIFPGNNFSFGSTTTAYANQVLTVLEYANNPVTTDRTITGQAIFALISHGNNQNCAYPANGVSPNSSCPINNEAINSSNKYNTNFTDKNIIYSSTNPNFDDIVLFKTKNQIATDFNAHHLLLCSISSSESTNYNTIASGTPRSTAQSLFYEQNLFNIDQNNSCQLICGKYGQLFYSNTTCTTPTP